MRPDIEALEEAFLSSDLADMVDLVLSRPDDVTYRAASRQGQIGFVRSDGSQATVPFSVIERSGSDPLAQQSLKVLPSLDAERANHVAGVRQVNSYPNAFESIAQFFDSPDAPELYICRKPGFDPEGNQGQHGSLGVVQARALFAASGAGIRPVAEASESERTVDIAPTIATLLGLEPGADGGHLARQDGKPLDHLLDGTTARHVVVLLLDGCNTNLLREVMDAGDAPHLRELTSGGSFLPHGMVSSLPTATLANHTAAITGRHPGSSGILNHTWLKRATGEVPELLSFEEMFWSSRHLSPETETIFEVIARQRPDTFTTATFEFCDRGASMSTFAMVRDGIASDLPDLADVRHVSGAAATEFPSYGFYSQVDHLGTVQTLDAWQGAQGNPLPVLTWASFALIDESGHRSGPIGQLTRQAVIDTDARVGEIVAAVDRAGRLEETAFLVISDHGMEQTDPEITGTWHDQLGGTGVSYRDIGHGLIYLT